MCTRVSAKGTRGVAPSVLAGARAPSSRRNTRVVTRALMHDRDGGLPAEVCKHEAGVPVPLGGHHQHRRRGEGREGAADGNVDEEHAEGGVHQPGGDAAAKNWSRRIRAARVMAAGSVMKEPSRGTKDSTSEIGGGGCRAGASPGHEPHQRAGGVQDGPRAGDDHDREDEHGLGEVARLDVVDGRGPNPQGKHEHHQHHGPEAEHHFHSRPAGARCPRGGAGVGQALEELGGEGVQDGDGEERCADDLDQGGFVHGRVCAAKAARPLHQPATAPDAP
jgi:hypothetical protein